MYAPYTQNQRAASEFENHDRQPTFPIQFILDVVPSNGINNPIWIWRGTGRREIKQNKIVHAILFGFFDKPVCHRKHTHWISPLRIYRFLLSFLHNSDDLLLSHIDGLGKKWCELGVSDILFAYETKMMPFLSCRSDRFYILSTSRRFSFLYWSDRQEKEGAAVCLCLLLEMWKWWWWMDRKLQPHTAKEELRLELLLDWRGRCGFHFFGSVFCYQIQ